MLNSIIDLSERVEQGEWVVMVLEGEGGVKWRNVDGGERAKSRGWARVLLFHFTFITETVEY